MKERFTKYPFQGNAHGLTMFEVTHRPRVLELVVAIGCRGTVWLLRLCHPPDIDF